MVARCMKDAFGTALYQAGSNKPLTLASPEELIGKIIISVQYKLPIDICYNLQALSSFDYQFDINTAHIDTHTRTLYRARHWQQIKLVKGKEMSATRMKELKLIGPELRAEIAAIPTDDSSCVGNFPT